MQKSPREQAVNEKKYDPYINGTRELDIHNLAKQDYEKNGIVVKCSLPELIQTIKEYEK